MTTGWHASRIGIGGFLAPFLFVYQPALLMRGSWGEIAVAFGSALVGIAALSAAVTGHMFGPLSWAQRAFLGVVSLAAISHHVGVSVVTSLVLIAFALWDSRRARRATAAPLVVSEPARIGTGEGPPLT
jgi:TRAP-type uncharacterized transport system fused permease subunit